MTAGVLLSVLIVLAPPLQGAPPQTATATPLEGTWLLTALTYKGQSVPGVPDIAFTFKGTSYEQELMGHVNESGTFALDARRGPMTIDFTIAEGADQGKLQLGIVEVSGATLRLHLGEPGAIARPVDFTPLPATMLITATRRQ
jgi:uncharacterized protein (TIGR03067 family)